MSEHAASGREMPDGVRGTQVRAARAARLDVALVEAGLQTSRTRAAKAVSAGRVSLGGRTVTKASTPVAAGALLAVSDADSDRWVGRAAHKLLGALETFDVEVAGLEALDAGASTGGFTQVLLESGAAHVISADVGHGQLHPSLAADPRVENREGTNLRYLTSTDIPDGVDLIVGDLSFISLTLLVGPLSTVLRPQGHVLLMVKPQFEVGRHALSRTGVVTDPAARRQAVESVLGAAQEAGLLTVGVGRSALPGQDGNVEFFVHLVPNTTGIEVVDRERLLSCVDYG